MHKRAVNISSSNFTFEIRLQQGESGPVNYYVVWKEAHLEIRLEDVTLACASLPLGEAQCL